MFAGHYSAAFLAKGVAPGVPLWVLLLAVQFVDVIWALLVLAGIERLRIDATLPSNALDLVHMPFTHSLVATAVWTALAFAVARRWLGGRQAGAVVAGAVASHWFLDLLVHRPDLPILTGPPKLGLALWDHPALAFALEIGLIVAGLVFCLRRPTVFARRSLPLLALAAGLVAAQLVHVLGPAPGSATAVVVPALVFFLAIPWIGSRIEDRAEEAA